MHQLKTLFLLPSRGSFSHSVRCGKAVNSSLCQYVVTSLMGVAKGATKSSSSFCCKSHACEFAAWQWPTLPPLKTTTTATTTSSIILLHCITIIQFLKKFFLFTVVICLLVWELLLLCSF